MLEPQENERKARDLVRLVLFHEQRSMPLKQNGISSLVPVMLGYHPRSFNAVYAAANNILKRTFGMELVELHSSLPDHEIKEKDAEMLKAAGKAASTGTKSYILRSTLDPALIHKRHAHQTLRFASLSRRRIQTRTRSSRRAEDDNQVGTRSTGSIIAWHHADQLASVGILYVILALILVEGRSINDNDLRAILKRLQLPSNASIPLSSQSTSQNLSIDAYLNQLARQGYLDKHRLGGGGRGAPKRARASQHGTQAVSGAHDDSVLAAYEWRWGPRAHAEVGERGIAQFVSEFMAVRPGMGGADNEGEDGESEDAVGAPEDEGTRKRVEIIFKGIERAAVGAPLANVR
ncbi:hypothetical protein PYCCODRAFT_1477861 [Trametes coccinea BRFM310]|uniref:MAGE domain-containing protein n=1 Tax=Trametes coccinea (strain BRFM310) TaxID=1353009 RepID=A0A1Y2IMG3_TRAC3|nr:hypothetical protein PYCCODRAFT_1477861 [Trametes coccinea BRFM310]